MKIVSRFRLSSDGTEWRNNHRYTTLYMCEDRVLVVSASDVLFNVSSIYSIDGELIKRYYLRGERLYLLPPAFSHRRDMYAKVVCEMPVETRNVLQFCIDEDEVCRHTVYGIPSFGVDGTYAFFSNKDRSTLTIVADGNSNEIRIGVNACNVFVYDKNNIAITRKYYLNHPTADVEVLSFDGSEKLICKNIADFVTRVAFCSKGKVIFVSDAKLSLSCGYSRIIVASRYGIYDTYAALENAHAVAMIGDYPAVVRSAESDSLYVKVKDTYVRLYKFDSEICDSAIYEDKLALLMRDNSVCILDTEYNEDAILTSVIRDSL